MPFTIVVVDDDLQYQEFIAHILGPASETLTVVGYATNGPGGLALVRELRPDLVITDLYMPGFNGVELTRHIRRELPETKVILISSNIEDAYQAMASDSGADAFVSKSVLFESLLAAVHDVFRRRLAGGSWPVPEAGSAKLSRAKEAQYDATARGPGGADPREDPHRPTAQGTLPHDLVWARARRPLRRL